MIQCIKQLEYYYNFYFSTKILKKKSNDPMGIGENYYDQTIENATFKIFFQIIIES